jgi:hypothetical protein
LTSRRTFRLSKRLSASVLSSLYSFWVTQNAGLTPVGHQSFIPRFLGVNKNEFRHPVRSLDT